MTAIQLSAGRKHTIKVGDKVQEVTLRPGEVRYLPFLRKVMDIPKVPKAVLPEKPRIAPSTRVTYDSWSRARPQPTFDDIIELVKGVQGRKNLGFTPTLDNLVGVLRKYKKK